MVEWLPIESAPKGCEGSSYGPDLLLWDGHVVVGSYYRYPPERGFWEDGEERTLNPTHWMPLPPPPSA